MRSLVAIYEKKKEANIYSVFKN